MLALTVMKLSESLLTSYVKKEKSNQKLNLITFRVCDLSGGLEGIFGLKTSGFDRSYYRFLLITRRLREDSIRQTEE